MAAMEQYRRTHHEERRFENWMKGFSTEIHRVVGKTGNMAEKEVTDCIVSITYAKTRDVTKIYRWQIYYWSTL